MSILKTITGRTFDTSRPVRSNLMMKFTEGTTIMQQLDILSISGIRAEFGENKTYLLLRDEFLQTHEICEDFIWH